MKWTIESVGKEMFNILLDGGIVGFALRLSNGSWAAVGDAGQLTDETFVAPVEVRKWFSENWDGAKNRSRT